MEQRKGFDAGDPIRVVLIRDGKRVSAEVYWGLIPHYYPPEQTLHARPTMIRDDHLLTQDISKAAVKYRRCLIPMNEFQTMGRAEGKGRKPYRMYNANAKLFGVAGIWELWMSAEKQRIETAALITVPANLTIAPVNDRMPAILDKASQDIWLNHDIPPDEAVKVLKPYYGDDLLVEEAGAAQKSIFSVDEA
jgi:putative SOS response-associated peptidase YedK